MYRRVGIQRLEWQWIWLFLAFVIGSQASAATIQLSKSQLDGFLSESFPMSYEAGEYQVTLSNPQPILVRGDNRIDLDVQVSARNPEGEQVFLGSGTVQGTLHLDTHRRQLQVVRSSLNDLESESETVESDQASDSLRQQLQEQRISQIVVADLYSITPRLPLQSMISVRVWNEAVVIEY